MSCSAEVLTTFISKSILNSSHKNEMMNAFYKAFNSLREDGALTKDNAMAIANALLEANVQFLNDTTK
jgi:hypothetical protein